MSQTAYPEHDKLSAVRSESQAIGEFLEWLATETPYQLAEYATGPDPEAQYEIVDKGRELRYRYRLWISHPYGRDLIGRYETQDEARAEMIRRQNADHDRAARQVLVPAYPNVQDLLAKYFGIDRAALEAEKRAMLAALRQSA